MTTTRSPRQNLMQNFVVYTQTHPDSAESRSAVINTIFAWVGRRFRHVLPMPSETSVREEIADALCADMEISSEASVDDGPVGDRIFIAMTNHTQALQERIPTTHDERVAAIDALCIERSANRCHQSSQ